MGLITNNSKITPKKSPQKAVPPPKAIDEGDESDSEDDEAAMIAEQINASKNSLLATAGSSDEEEGDEDDDEEAMEDGEEASEPETTKIMVSGAKTPKQLKNFLSKTEDEEKFALDLESLDDAKKALALDEPKLNGSELTITAVKSEKAKAQKRKASDDDDDSEEGDVIGDNVTTILEISGYHKLGKIRSFLRSNFVSFNKATADGNITTVECSSAADALKALGIEKPQIRGNDLHIKTKQTTTEPHAAKKAKGDEADSDQVCKGVSLFVKGFLKNTTAKDDLKVAFPGCIDINLPEFYGSPKGFAYLTFETVEECEALINGPDVIIGDRTLVIDYAGDKAQKTTSLEQMKGLFVKNLAWSVTEEQIKKLFPEANRVKLRLGEKGKASGNASVRFDCEADFDAAVEKYQGFQFAGRPMKLEYEGRKGRKGPSQEKTVVLKKLPKKTTDAQLKKQFPQATGTKVIMDLDTGDCKGFAYVDFKSNADAIQALITNKEKAFKLEGTNIEMEIKKPSHKKKPKAGTVKRRKGDKTYVPSY